MAQSDKTADQITRRYGNRSATERREERRQRLLKAAVNCFSRRGFSATSIEQLCAAAKVSTRSFYEEFGGREAILSELHDELNDAAFASARHALADCQSPDVVDVVRAGLNAYFNVMTNDRAWARVVLIEAVGVSPELERRRQGAVDRFASLVVDESATMVAAGLIADRDYSLTAIAVVGAVKELVTAWAVHPTDVQLERAVDEAVRLTVAAVAGPA